MRATTNVMIAIAKGMTEDETKAAAEYFGSMKWTPWIKVVEAAMVPKTRIAGGMFLRNEGSETEPIADRIIETPENVEGTEVLRDARSGFIAYVPPGSVKRGEALVKSGGGGKTTPCGVCPGADLMGLGPVPGIAGRSPSYMVRQLYDMQQGVRKGVWSDLMKPVVANLTDADMLAIAAYRLALDSLGRRRWRPGCSISRTRPELVRDGERVAFSIWLRSSMYSSLPSRNSAIDGDEGA